jgi:hypothetical protein
MVQMPGLSYLEVKTKLKVIASVEVKEGWHIFANLRKLPFFGDRSDYLVAFDHGTQRMDHWELRHKLNLAF